jgi:2-dehydropantoate 2-reductase
MPTTIRPDRMTGWQLPPGRRILVAGAGSVGCHAGGCLARAGLPVTLLLRPRLAERLANGLHLSDLDGADWHLPPGTVRLATDAAEAMANAGLVLVTVKGGDTDNIAHLIAAFAPADAPVVSLQNGIGNAERLAALLPGRRVLAGMVPFNILQMPDGRFHRGTSGTVMLADDLPGLAAALNVPGWPVAGRADMDAVLWGKLLLNLNNGLNALSGLPLVQQVADRRWRCLLAAQMAEALGLLRQAGIRPAKVSGVMPALLPPVLRLPDWLFRRLAASMLRMDPLARSSMWEDLQRGRMTEIDHLQGAVLALAQRLFHDPALAAPTCARVLALVRQAERAEAGSPNLSPDAVTGSPPPAR